jgi:hypothetical protein
MTTFDLTYRVIDGLKRAARRVQFVDDKGNDVSAVSGPVGSHIERPIAAADTETVDLPEGGASRAYIQTSAAVRLRLDHAAPDADTGFLIDAGVAQVWDCRGADNLRFYSADGCTLQIQFMS